MQRPADVGDRLEAGTGPQGEVAGDRWAGEGRRLRSGHVRCPQRDEQQRDRERGSDGDPEGHSWGGPAVQPGPAVSWDDQVAQGHVASPDGAQGKSLEGRGTEDSSVSLGGQTGMRKG